jgi:hypothetical protein
MPELLIRRPDDSGQYDSTMIRFGEEGHYQTVTLYPTRYRSAVNPLIESIKIWLMGELKMSRKNLYNRTYRRGYYRPIEEAANAPVEFSHTIYIGDSGFVILFNKAKTRYYINGMMANKEVLISSLARTIYKSCFTEDSFELERFLIKHIQLPEMVSYALENRAPYYFFIDIEDDIRGNYQKKIECRLKANLISDNNVALEISDGVWGELTIKQFNSYLNSYIKKRKQSKWSNLSPSELWFKLMKRNSTESEEQLMLCFLSQNRTEKVVKERARDLMIHLSNRYPNRIKINWGSPDKLLDVSQTPTIMYINGKLADWKLTDRGLKSQGQQNVSTFVWAHDRGQEKGSWLGPICVDNLDNNSPTGDQFVTRALGLLNDHLLIERVSTIKGRLNSRHDLNQTNQRISLFQ